METLETPETLNLFEDESQFLAPACPASQQVLPGSDAARAMTVGSGRQCSMLLDLSSPLGRFSKILLGSLHWTNSEEFSYVWNRLDTRFALSAFQLTPLGQSTEDSECSLWRTPNGSDVTGGPSDGERRLAQGHQLNLQDVCLERFVQMFPTPTARDFKNGKGKTQEERGRTAGPTLSETFQGSLNPRFVEELMGFPIDHTALKRSATPLSRSKRIRSSAQLHK